MSWWDYLTSFAAGLRNNVGTMQSLLKDYIKGYAQWGASHADDYFDILRHSWSDVRNLIDSQMSGYYNNVNDFYNSLTSKLRSDYSILNKSWYNVTSYVDNAVSGISGSVGNIVTKVNTLYDYAHTTLRNQITSLSQDIDNLSDDIYGITRTAAKTVSFIGYEAERRWGILKKSWSDITGAINASKTAIKIGYIDPLTSNLNSLTSKFNTLKDVTVKNLTYDITSLTIKLTKLTNDVVASISRELTALSAKVNTLQSWVWKSFTDVSDDFIEQFIKVFTASESKSVRFLTALGIGAGEVITTILDTPKDMVMWIKNDIADVFEDILDRVFK